MFRVRTVVGKPLLTRSFATIRLPMTVESRWIGRKPNAVVFQYGGLSFRMLSVDAKNVVNVDTTNVQTKKARAKKAKSTDVTEESIKEIANTVIPLLEIYRKVHQHSSVPLSFIVPAEAPWPSHAFGVTLGFHLTVLRKHIKLIAWADERRLTELGMCWSQQEVLRVEKFVRAVQAYQTVFGNLNIPWRYIVPSDSKDWDTDLHGYRLGKFIEYIQQGGYALHIRRFYDLGLEYHLNRARFDLKNALEVYKEIHGHCGVPTHFMVDANDDRYPASIRGVDFGRMCRMLLLARKISHEDLESFKAMGLRSIRGTDQTADRICSAIRCFQQVYGVTREIPTAFVVPEGSSSYPPELWGMALGEYLRRITRLGQLEAYHDRFRALGIAIEGVVKRDVGQWSAIVAQLLRIYERQYESTCVPQAFVVPREKPWPEEYHDFALGHKVHMLRGKKKLLTDHAYQNLTDAGMIWSLRQYNAECLDQGVEVFKAIHGHLDIPFEFTVPRNDRQWPQRLWGFNLGTRFYRVGQTRIKPERYERWTALGVVFTPRARPQKIEAKARYADILQAFRVFHVKHGHYDVPHSYFIAPDDTAYPERCRGKNLGRTLQKIREGVLFPQHRGEIEAMGIRVRRKNVLQAELICEAVQCYRQVHGLAATAIPPRQYVVPSESNTFPEKMRGMPLGKLCHRIIHKQYLLKCRDMLIAAGIVQK